MDVVTPSLSAPPDATVRRACAAVLSLRSAARCVTARPEFDGPTDGLAFRGIGLCRQPRLGVHTPHRTDEIGKPRFASHPINDRGRDVELDARP